MTDHELSDRVPEDHSQQMNYGAMIRAYKIIREFSLIEKEQLNPELEVRFYSWFTANAYRQEKEIALQVVFDEIFSQHFVLSRETWTEEV